MDTYQAIRRHFKVLKEMSKFHVGSIIFIIRYKLKDIFFFKRVNAKSAHAIYIGYRDQKLKEIYKSIRISSKMGYTSTNVMLYDKETAYQFKVILEKDGYIVKIADNPNKSSSYKFDVLISWASDDLHEMNKYL